MLICRVKQWPTAEQQAALIEQMLTLGLRRPITSALLDLTALGEPPDPDTLAEAIARAVGQNALFSRVACVTHTEKQQRFAALLRQMVTRPDEVAVFGSEAEGLRWLGVRTVEPR